MQMIMKNVSPQRSQFVAGPGPDDLSLQFPDEFLAEVGWLAGDTLDVEAKSESSLIVRNLSWEARCNQPDKRMKAILGEDGSVGLVADSVPVEAVEGLLKKLERRKARLDKKIPK